MLVSNIVYFHMFTPILEVSWSNLTSIFFNKGWFNHLLDKVSHSTYKLAPPPWFRKPPGLSMAWERPSLHCISVGSCHNNVIYLPSSNRTGNMHNGVPCALVSWWNFNYWYNFDCIAKTRVHCMFGHLRWWGKFPMISMSSWGGVFDAIQCAGAVPKGSRLAFP